MFMVRQEGLRKQTSFMVKGRVAARHFTAMLAKHFDSLEGEIDKIEDPSLLMLGRIYEGQELSVAHYTRVLPLEIIL